MRRAAEAAIVPTLAFAVAAILMPGRLELAAHVWMLVVLTIGLIALVAGIREDVPPGGDGFDAALRRTPTGVARPPSLARVERELSMGAETASDAHYRLRPLFREVAAGVLLTRHGVDLGRAPARAKALVGEDLWALIRPGIPAPDERGGPGIPTAAVTRAVDDLERLTWS